MTRGAPLVLSAAALRRLQHGLRLTDDSEIGDAIKRRRPHGF